jgi:formylglycine-generating enzyme required for sulfatase activity
VHRVRLPAFRIADVPVSWARYAALMGWPPPPDLPDEGESVPEHIRSLWFFAKIWGTYCGTGPAGSGDGDWEEGELYPSVYNRPDGIDWDSNPLVAIAPIHAEDLAARLGSLGGGRYALPTEAQWEKAARGGRIGARYPWGDEPPTPERCDFDHFGRFTVAPSRSRPPNDYGLFAMCGGVCEWTATPYDALAYRGAEPASAGEAVERVIRGGSFSDCAAAVTVSFRASRIPTRHALPNVGFRLIREVSESRSD